MSIELINWLLAQGVSASVLNQQGQSALHLLIKNHQVQLTGKEDKQQAIREQLINSLMQQGLNINARDLNGRSALHYAFEKKLAWISPLLKAGINPNLQSNIEESALSLAIGQIKYTKDKDLQIIKALLAYQADPNLRNSQGETSLFLAYRLKNPELIQLLLQYGANPSLKSYYGKIAGQN